MKIYLAKSAGFCFGVKRAIRMSLKEAEKEPISTYGPLIHNPDEVARLSSLGILEGTTIDDITTQKVVIRTHGLPPNEVDFLESSGKELIDATCPFVKKSQQIAEALKNDGYQVVIVGDKNHPEVIGILGYSGENAIVVSSLDEAKATAFPKKVGVLSQTTQAENCFNKIVEHIKSVSSDVEVFNTICAATKERQKEAADLAKQVDMMLVIGGKNSANTKKLATIAKDMGTVTHTIENVNDLKNINFSEVKKLGITAGASTPNWIIEEVMVQMSELNKEEVLEKVVTEEQTTTETAETAVENQKEETVAAEDHEETMAESFAAYDKELAVIRRGARVTGTIIKVTDSELMVDIGGKTEGIVPKNELTPSEAEHMTELFHEGDEIEVIVLRKENEEGHSVLSKKRIDIDQAWKKLANAMKENEVLEGEVIDVVKGGLLVDVGLKGFVPASLVELGYVKKLDSYLGQTIKFKVLECDKNHNKLILSRKVCLEEEKAKKSEAAWASLAEGQVRRGTVQRITNFGAFVDLDGVDGLLHVSQMAWYRVNHPSEVLSIGDEIDVYVLSVDKENEKISLSLKQLIPNPWTFVPDNYPVDSIVEAKVVRTASFGAFVQLEPGVEGLVHISQLTHGRVAKTEDAVQPGDIVKVKVLGFDLDNKKISLSIKETLPAPEAEEAPVQNKEADDTVMPEQDEQPVTLGDIMPEMNID